MITVQHATVTARIIATIIDYFIVFEFSFTYIYEFGTPNDEGGREINGVPALLPMVFWFLWLVIPEYMFGQTAGHAMARIKVVSAAYGKVGLMQIIKRRICDPIDISCV